MLANLQLLLLLRLASLVHRLSQGSSAQSHVVVACVLLSIWVSTASIARSILVLRVVCSVGLIDGVSSPLVVLLVLDHLLEVLLHWLGQLAIRIQRCVVSVVHLRVLIVHIHAPAAREVTVANHQTLISKQLSDIVQESILTKSGSELFQSDNSLIK